LSNLKPLNHKDIYIHTQINPRSPNQSAYLESMQQNVFTFAIGRAGTGKSLLCLWQAILELLDSKSKIKKLVIVRPCIGNKFGEELGSLPGDLLEKMLPHCLSVVDSALNFVDRGTIYKLIEDGTIEFIPLTLLRGRSLNNAFVIVEEAQNIKLSGKGVYMVMSRLGNHSKMVFNGDLAQADLNDTDSALEDAITRLKGLKGCGIVELYDRQDVQRHPLLYSIMERFGEIDEHESPFEGF